MTINISIIISSFHSLRNKRRTCFEKPLQPTSWFEGNCYSMLLWISGKDGSCCKIFLPKSLWQNLKLGWLFEREKTPGFSLHCFFLSPTYSIVELNRNNNHESGHLTLKISEYWKIEKLPPENVSMNKIP